MLDCSFHSNGSQCFSGVIRIYLIEILVLYIETMSTANDNVAAQTPAMDQSNTLNRSADTDKTCVVCFKIVDIFSIGECDHPVCYECSTSNIRCATHATYKHTFSSLTCTAYDWTPHDFDLEWERSRLMKIVLLPFLLGWIGCVWCIDLMTIASMTIADHLRWFIWQKECVYYVNKTSVRYADGWTKKSFSHRRFNRTES